jgi:hypothetical protein
MRHPKSSPRSQLKVVNLSYSVSLSLILLLFTCLFLSNVQIFAQQQSRAIRLSYVHGTAQVMMGNQSEFQKAYANMPLPEGTRLQTGNDGRAELQFEDGSVARLTPNSSLVLSQLKADSNGFRTTQIEFLSGLGYFELEPQSNTDQISVVYQQNQVVSGSPAIFRLNVDNPPGELNVLLGDVHVTGGEGYSAEVHADERVRLGAGDGVGYEIAQGVSEESWDQWNGERDQLLDKQAEQQTAATASAPDSSNPAWGDLDAYGNWYDVNGYGQVWAPYGAGPNWDPYGYGYWASYPGAGYLWVSGYPWGYLPYQCGAWNYFNTFGWGWIPGGCGAGFWGAGFWANPIVIWNAPRGYLPPRRPVVNRPVKALPLSPSVIAVDRGQSVRYKPQPIYGVGGVARPVVTIAGKSVNPMPPLRAGNGFVGQPGNRGTTIVSPSGVPRTPGPPNITTGRPGSTIWNTVPSPSQGVRPGTVAPPYGGNPVQRTQPITPVPRPVQPPVTPRMNPVPRPVPAPVTPRVMPPSSMPRPVPAPAPMPRPAPVPAPAPRMMAPPVARPAPMPSMPPPAMRSAPAPAPAARPR